MKRSRITLLVGVVSAGLVLVMAAALTERHSPGPISAVHVGIEGLDGGQACAACHGGWFGDMQGACTKCHEEIKAQLAEQRGLHGAVAGASGGQCSTCHGEHHGAEFRLVNRLAFAQAGIAEAEKFDHSLVNFEMAGAHLVLACTECHANADVELLPEGQHRYLGLQQACGSCHEDVHQGRMQFACASCHSQTDFRQPAAADHDRWLPLGGAHAAVQCRQCHAADDSRALEKLRPGAHNSARQCGDCHQTPHSDAFVVGNARSEGSTKAAICVSCHRLDVEHFADPRVMVTATQHLHGGFALTRPHDQAVCAKCHAPGGAYSDRHTGRRADDCVACHQDPHGDQFADGVFGQQGCIGCHARTHFEPHAFDLDHHARTSLPLDGRHAELTCQQCHADPAAGQPRRFEGTPSRCEQCHGDAHRGAFEQAAARLQARPRGTCAECHGTAAWGDIELARFDHDDWTGFAIDGAHAQIECTDCHVRSETKDEFGRQFGRIPEHAQGTANCTSCHHDPHEGAFDKPEVPSEVEGRTGCQRCHGTASFRALRSGFDHGKFTGFDLLGKHGEQPCTACHEHLGSATEIGRTWGKARGNDCVDCHHDPHLRQFERLGRTNCVRCHKSTTTFATLSFRHNLDSHFNLGEQHTKVPCASCHKRETIEGVETTRYKPLPTDCASCHGRAEGGAGSRRRRQ